MCRAHRSGMQISSGVQLTHHSERSYQTCRINLKPAEQLSCRRASYLSPRSIMSLAESHPSNLASTSLHSFWRICSHKTDLGSPGCNKQNITIGSNVVNHVA